MTDTQRVPEEKWADDVWPEKLWIGGDKDRPWRIWWDADFPGLTCRCYVPLTALEEERERAETDKASLRMERDAALHMDRKNNEELFDRLETAEKEQDRLETGLREEIERLEERAKFWDGPPSSTASTIAHKLASASANRLTQLLDRSEGES